MRRAKQLLLTVLVSLGIIFFTTPTLAQEAETPSQLTVVAAALNVRSGPALSHPAFTYLLAGDQVEVMAYDAALDWWEVRLADGRLGWVSGGPEYVAVTGEATLEAPSGSTSPTVAPTTGATLVFQTASGGPIYAIDPSGGTPRLLTTGLDPALSLDGQWLAFTRWTTDQNGALGSLLVMPVAGGAPRTLLIDSAQPRTPVWSPDGSQILLTVQHGGRITPERTCSGSRPPREAFDIEVKRNGREVEYCYTLPPNPFWGLRVVDVASGAFQDLPHDTFSYSPSWDPRNDWHIVYDGTQGLVNLDLNLGTAWPLTEDVNDRSPQFSPDGQKIVVSYWQHDHWEVHRLNADGSGRVRLTETSLLELVQQELRGETAHSWDNAAPVWSPDGSQIAFLSDRSGAWEIWLMNADGTNQYPMFSGETMAGITLQYNGVNERVLAWR